MAVSRTEFEELKVLLEKTIEENKSLREQNEDFQRIIFSEVKRDQEQTLRNLKQSILQECTKLIQENHNKDNKDNKQTKPLFDDTQSQQKKVDDTVQQLNRNFQTIKDRFMLLDTHVSDLDRQVIEFKSEQIPANFQRQISDLKSAMDIEYAHYFKNFVSMKEFQKIHEQYESLETQVRQIKTTSFQQASSYKQLEVFLQETFSEERWISLEKTLMETVKKEQDLFKKDIKSSQMMERVKLFADIEKQKQKDSEVEISLRKELSRTIYTQEIEALYKKVSLEFIKSEEEIFKKLVKTTDEKIQQTIVPIQTRMETLETRENPEKSKEVETLNEYVKNMERALLEEIQKVSKPQKQDMGSIIEPFTKLQAEFGLIRSQWSSVKSSNIEEMFKKELIVLRTKCESQLDTLRANLTDTEEFKKFKAGLERVEILTKETHLDVFKHKGYFETFEAKYNEAYFKSLDEKTERKQRLFESYLESNVVQRLENTKQEIKKDLSEITDKSHKGHMFIVNNILQQFKKKQDDFLFISRNSLDDYNRRVKEIHERNKGIDELFKDLSIQIQEKLEKRIIEKAEEVRVNYIQRGDELIQHIASERMDESFLNSFDERLIKKFEKRFQIDIQHFLENQVNAQTNMLLKDFLEKAYRDEEAEFYKLVQQLVKKIHESSFRILIEQNAKMIESHSRSGGSGSNGGSGGSGSSGGSEFLLENTNIPSLPPVHLRTMENIYLSPKIRKCFMSACIGNKGQTVDRIVPFPKIPGWDMIIFTNLVLPAKLSWDIRKIVRQYDDPAIEAKMYKWLTNKFLPEYDIVVWIDCYLSPNPNMIQNFESLLNKAFYVDNKTTIHRYHKERRCVWDECTAVIDSKRATIESVQKNMRLLNKIEMPRNFGLFDTNVVCKMNKDPETIKVGEQIFKTLLETSNRDQLAVTPTYFTNDYKRYAVQDLSPMFLKTGTHVRIPAFL